MQATFRMQCNDVEISLHPPKILRSQATARFPQQDCKKPRDFSCNDFSSLAATLYFSYCPKNSSSLESEDFGCNIVRKSLRREKKRTVGFLLQLCPVQHCPKISRSQKTWRFRVLHSPKILLSHIIIFYSVVGLLCYVQRSFPALFVSYVLHSKAPQKKPHAAL